MRWLCCHSLEKGVAEHAIGFCRTIKIADPRIECRGIDDAGRECLLPYGFNHPRERFPREAIDQIRCRRVNVDDARCHAWRLIAGLREQRIQLPADTGIPAGPPPRRVPSRAPAMRSHDRMRRSARLDYCARD